MSRRSSVASLQFDRSTPTVPVRTHVVTALSALKDSESEVQSALPKLRRPDSSKTHTATATPNPNPPSVPKKKKSKKKSSSSSNPIHFSFLEAKKYAWGKFLTYEKRRLRRAVRAQFRATRASYSAASPSSSSSSSHHQRLSEALSSINDSRIRFQHRLLYRALFGKKSQPQRNQSRPSPSPATFGGGSPTFRNRAIRAGRDEAVRVLVNKLLVLLMLYVGSVLAFEKMRFERKELQESARGGAESIQKLIQEAKATKELEREYRKKKMLSLTLDASAAGRAAVVAAAASQNSSSSGNGSGAIAGNVFAEMRKSDVSAVVEPSMPAILGFPSSANAVTVRIRELGEEIERARCEAAKNLTQTSYVYSLMLQKIRFQDFRDETRFYESLYMICRTLGTLVCFTNPTLSHVVENEVERLFRSGKYVVGEHSADAFRSRQKMKEFTAHRNMVAAVAKRRRELLAQKKRRRKAEAAEALVLEDDKKKKKKKRQNAPSSSPSPSSSSPVPRRVSDVSKAAPIRAAAQRRRRKKSGGATISRPSRPYPAIKVTSTRTHRLKQRRKLSSLSRLGLAARRSPLIKVVYPSDLTNLGQLNTNFEISDDVLHESLRDEYRAKMNDKRRRRLEAQKRRRAHRRAARERLRNGRGFDRSRSGGGGGEEEEEVEDEDSIIQRIMFGGSAASTPRSRSKGARIRRKIMSHTHLAEMSDENDVSEAVARDSDDDSDVDDENDVDALIQRYFEEFRLRGFEIEKALNCTAREIRTGNEIDRRIEQVAAARQKWRGVKQTSRVSLIGRYDQTRSRHSSQKEPPVVSGLRGKARRNRGLTEPVRRASGKKANAGSAKRFASDPVVTSPGRRPGGGGQQQQLQLQLQQQKRQVDGVKRK